MLESFLIGLGFFLLAQDGAAPAAPVKVEGKLEIGGKYQVSGHKVKITAILPSAAAAHTSDSIKVESMMGEKPVNSQPLGQSVLVEAGAGGSQKRVGEWTVPDLPSGPATLSWRCGEEEVGKASIIVLKPIRDVDWDKAEEAVLGKTAVLIQTDLGQMLIEFYPDKAPDTVRNFLKLAGKGFYDGLTFHRILKDWMVHGGDPQGNGSGDPGYRIKAEINDVKHVKGVVSMARSSGNVDSAGCQFFVVHGKHIAGWDGQYTAFGKLMDNDSFETLDRLAATPTEKSARGEASKPKVKVFMRKAIVVEKPIAQ